MVKKKQNTKKKSNFWISSKKINWPVFIASLAIVFVVAYLGTTFTDTGEWYNSVKPTITPPNYVFPIVWTILFYFITLSLYYTITSSKGKHDFKIGIAFGLNFLFNILWTFFYFKLHNPLYALIDIILLICSIIYLIIFSYKIDKRAGLILIPYLLWVCFATILNYLTLLNI